MTWSSDLYVRALRFAAERHAGQLVPGSELPYVLHVVQVAAELQRALVAEPTPRADLAVACALLHDTVEDTECTVEDIAAAFGPAVAAGVSALSKDPRMPKADAMADSLRRIREQPREVWMVKLADRITNLAPPPGHWSLDKRQAYLVEGRLIASELGVASEWLHARLLRRAGEYQAYLVQPSAAG